jgi:hypothetical protein
MFVIPAQAGIHFDLKRSKKNWIPAPDQVRGDVLSPE